jgi:hypothetical protein
VGLTHFQTIYPHITDKGPFVDFKPRLGRLKPEILMRKVAYGRLQPESPSFHHEILEVVMLVLLRWRKDGCIETYRRFTRSVNLVR